MLAFTSIALTGQYGTVQTLPAENTAPEQLRLWLTGTVFKGNQSLTALQLEEGLILALQQRQLPEYCRTLNGFFSIVWRQPSGFVLISDKVRSRPLFWHSASKMQQQAIVSDSVYQWLHHDLVPDPLSVEEFLHTGYVTGSDTLFKGIQQLESAQLVELNAEGQLIRAQSYYDFLATGVESNLTTAESEAFWLEQLDDKMTAVTARLIQYANGRQIVLPLSGGYDSRILAIYLKRSGYPHLCCFTFGRKGSKEVQTSQQVAHALGLPWHHVVYSRTMWQQLSAQDEFEDYLQFMHGAVSVPNLQVYPALKQLIAQAVIQPDAVMVPGHTGDFISGGHLPAAVLQNAEQLYRHIVGRHYELSKTALSQALAAKLQLQLDRMTQRAAPAQAGLGAVAECWNWKERQAKFIANSNRYYDFFNLDWWMPLWDSELVDLWPEVPYQLRKGKSLWIRFVNQQMLDTTGQGITGNADAAGSHWKKKAKSFFNYFFDSNSIYALMPFSRWLAYRCKLSKKPPFLFSFLAEQRIDRMKRRYNGINEK